VALTFHEKYIHTGGLRVLDAAKGHDAGDPGAPGDLRMTGHVRTKAGGLSVITLVAVLASAPGCEFAVNHPAVTAGIVGGTLGLATCKLASDNIGACLAVGGGAGAFLGLVAATALWLGGDGHSVMIEQQAQPLPDDGRPRRRRKPPVDPAEPGPPPASPSPTAPNSGSPNPDSPNPAPPPPTAPAPSPTAPAPTAPAPTAPPSPTAPSPTSPAPAPPP